jgi:hypothetical protein
MKIRIALAALFLGLLPAAAHADPLVITAGQFVGTGPYAGSTSLNISGQNFSFSGFTANPTQIQNGGLFPGGTTRPVGGTQFFSETNTLCFNGSCVTHDNPFDPDVASGTFTFNGGTFHFPQFGSAPPAALTFTVPFTMTGQLLGLRFGEQTPTTLLVVGQGEMTFTYGTFVLNGETHYEFRRVEANFATPTPEPATFLLLMSGLAGAAAARRRRRR